MRTVAIDFDGVIHKYSRGWDDGSIYDKENEGAFEYIRDLMRNGYSVFIFSTRSPRQIKRWLDDKLWFYSPMFAEDHYDREFIYGYNSEIIPFWKKFWDKKNVLGITKRKLPAVAYIDDRAVPFVSFGALPSEF